MTIQNKLTYARIDLRIALGVAVLVVLRLIGGLDIQSGAESRYIDSAGQL